MEDSTKIGIAAAVLVGIGVYLKFIRKGEAVAEAAKEDPGTGGGGGGSAPDAIRTVMPVMVADISPVITPRAIQQLPRALDLTATVNPNLVAKPVVRPGATSSGATAVAAPRPGASSTTPTTKPVPKGGIIGGTVKLGADGYQWKSDY